MKRVFLFGNASGKASVIVRIAVMAAVTLIVQWLVGLSKIQLLTGSFVNMCLLIAAMTTGIVGGICVGIVTPFIALGLGLNPNVLLVPFIAVSNAVYVVIFGVVVWLLRVDSGSTKRFWYNLLVSAAAIVLAAGLKFAFLYFVGVKWIYPLLFNVKQMETISVIMGALQWFTALIGGGAALALSYALRPARLVGYRNFAPAVAEEISEAIADTVSEELKESFLEEENADGGKAQSEDDAQTVLK